ncbi:rRNA maturation RNase YbeY [Catenovulum sp. SM1970]|uniref:rRNA maturation RNase YbeY n=1 Tax=Marinifaba aquimaris TaxID=2741323 RepID=UPI0015719F22|nr:rRNA maturation RNase YbeY [Marinifaba aquimaris]NTS78403.1 rRNA maturation RNase YbeY [Marinifaba aquimaris]
MTNLMLDLQSAVGDINHPNVEKMQLWLTTALAAEAEPGDYELTVRVVENDESQQLNGQYRGKDKPTNVLSFPFEAPKGIQLPLLGDLIVAQDVVADEAVIQNKQLEAHWAHMLVHGCLHLLGYDHIDDDEAEEMESKEIAILAELGFDNPYQDD